MAINPLTQSNLPQDTTKNPITQGSNQLPEFQAPNLQPQRDALASQRVLSGQLDQATNALLNPTQVQQESTLPSYEELTRKTAQQREQAIQQAGQKAEQKVSTQDQAYTRIANQQLYAMVQNDKSFVENYGNLSQQGQRKLLRQLAERATQDGGDVDRMYKELMKATGASISNDKASKPDTEYSISERILGVPRDVVAVGESAVGKLINLPAQVMNIGVNALAYGTASIDKGLDAVLGKHSGSLAERQAVYAKQYGATQLRGMIEGTDKAFSETSDAIRSTKTTDKNREYSEQEGFKDTVGYTLRNPLLAIQYYAPDMLGAMGTVGLANRASTALNAGRAINKTTLASAIDSASPAMTYGQAVRQVGVPSAVYATGGMVTDMSNDEGVIAPNQMTALLASGIVSASLGGLSTRFGGSPEALMLRNRGVPQWISENTALRIGQAIGVEAGTEALEEGVQTTAQVAQGDSNNPIYTWQNVVDNREAIYTGMAIGGMMGGVFGGVSGAVDARSKSNPIVPPATQFDEAVTAEQTANQTQTETAPNGVTVPTETQARPTGFGTTLLDSVLTNTEVVPTEVTVIAKELNNILNDGNITENGVEYIKSQAGEAITILQDMYAGQADASIETSTDVDVINSMIDVFNTIATDAPTIVEQSNLARADADANVSLESDLVSQVDNSTAQTTQTNGAYLTNNSNIQGYKVDSSLEGTLLYDADTGSYVLTDDNLSTRAGGSPEHHTTQETVVDTAPTTYNIGEQIDVGSNSYTIESAVPLYRAERGTGRERIGDRYLVSDSNNQQFTATILDGGDLAIDMGIRPRASADTTNTADGSVEMQVVAGTVTPTEALETSAPDAETVKSIQENAVRKQASQAKASRLSKARKEAQAEMTLAEDVIDWASYSYDPSVNDINFLEAVSEGNFTHGTNKKRIARALASKNEQSVIEALEQIARPKLGVSYQLDMMEARNILQGTITPPTPVASVYNTDSVDTELLATALTDQQAKPTVLAKETSILKSSRRVDDESRSETEKNLDTLITAGLTQESLVTLTRPDLLQLTRRLTTVRLPMSAMRVLIEVDMTRAKTESYDRAVKRLVQLQLASDTLPANERSTLEGSLDRLHAIATDLDQTLFEATEDQVNQEVERLTTKALQTDSSPMGDLVADVMAVPATDDSVLVSEVQDQMVHATEPAYDTGANVSADVVAEAIRDQGIYNTYTNRVAMWASNPARKLIRSATTNEQMYQALLDIQASGASAQLNTTRAKDALYASQLIELANIVQSDVDLGSASFTELTPPKSVVEKISVPDALSPYAQFTEATPYEDAVNRVGTASNPIDILMALEKSQDTIATTEAQVGRILNLVRSRPASNDLSEVEILLITNSLTKVAKLMDTITFINSRIELARETATRAQKFSKSVGRDKNLTDLRRSYLDKVTDLEATRSNIMIEMNKAKIESNQLLDSSPKYKALGDMMTDVLFPSIQRNDSAFDINADMLYRDTSSAMHDLFDTVAKSYGASETGGALYSAQYSNHVVMNTQTMREIFTALNIDMNETTFPKAKRFRGDNKLAFDAIEMTARNEIAYDALDHLEYNLGGDVFTLANVESATTALSALQSATGVQFLDGVANYVSGSDAGFLPKSEFDSYNFEGVYPFVENLQVDENGLVTLQSVRDFASNVLRHQPIERGRDRAIAEGLLHATNLARLSRAMFNGASATQLDFIRNANTVLPADPFMGSYNVELQSLMESGNYRDALMYISQHPESTTTNTQVVRALAELTPRFLDDVRVEIDQSPTAPHSASFDWNTYTIKFSGGTHANPYSVVHEFSHALADALFNAHENALNEKQIVARNALMEVYDFAKANNSVVDYGELNVREFIAEAFSNPVQQEMLRNLDTAGLTTLEKIRNMFDFFVDKLRDLFNLQPLHATRVERKAEQMIKGNKGKVSRNYKRSPKPEFDALTDIVSILHVYSKPTSARTALNGKAVTPTTDYIAGYQNAQAIMIFDKLDPFNDRRHAGFIRKISPVRYELQMFNGAKVGHMIGTLPQIENFLNGDGNQRYLLNKVVMMDTQVIEGIKWLKPVGVGKVTLAGAVVPPRLRKFLEAKLDQIAEKMTANELARGVADSNADMPFVFRAIDAYVTMSRFIRRLPNVNNGMDMLDAFYASAQETYADLLDSNVTASERWTQHYGERLAYSNGTNSILAGIRRDTEKYLIENGESQLSLGLYLNAKHVIERNAKNADKVRAGSTRTNEDWTGYTYDGKTGTEGAKAYLETVGIASEAVLESAYQRIRQEHLKLLELELSEGLITQNEYYRLREYEYYVPLLNIVRTEEDRAVDNKQIQGRFSQPANGYVSLYESLMNRQSSVAKNQALRAIVTKAQHLATQNILSVGSAETKLVYDTDTGATTLRASTNSQLNDHVAIVYMNGKPYIITPNNKTPVGAQLEAMFRNMNKANNRDGFLSAFNNFMRWVTTLSSMMLTTLSGAFLIKTMMWSLGLLGTNTQSAYRVSASDGATISRKSLARLGQLVISPRSYVAEQLGHNSDPMFRYFVQSGGGIIGITAGGQDTERNQDLTNSFTSDRADARSLARIPNADSLGNIMPSGVQRITNVLGKTARHAITSVGDVTNTFDMMARYASWQGAIDTIGTQKMKDALASNSLETLITELDANPDIKAKLIAGSKRITGNFQQKSSLDFLSGYFMFFNAGMQGADMLASLVRSKQGLVTGMVLASIGAVAISYGMDDPDDMGADGKSIMLRNDENVKAITFMVDGQRYHISLDYALRPFYAMGVYATAMANGEMDAMEATGRWSKILSESLSPVQPAQTENQGWNTMAMVLPTVIRNQLLPLMAGSTEFKYDVDEAPVFDEDGKMIKNPANWQKEGKYDWSTAVAKQLPFLSPRRVEAFASNSGGEPYRMLMAGMYGKSSDNADLLMRGIIPVERESMLLGVDFKDSLAKATESVSSTNVLEQGTVKNRVATQSANVLTSADKQQKGVKSAEGYTYGDTIRGLRNAQTDADKDLWLQRQAEVRFKRMQIQGQALQEVKALNKAEDEGTYESGQYTNALTQKREVVNRLYSDPEFADRMIERIK